MNREYHAAKSSGGRSGPFRLCLASYFKEGYPSTKKHTERHGGKLVESPMIQIIDDHPHITGFDRAYILDYGKDGGAAWVISREVLDNE